MQVWNVLHTARWKYKTQKFAQILHLRTIAPLVWLHLCKLLGPIDSKVHPPPDTLREQRISAAMGGGTPAVFGMDVLAWPQIDTIGGGFNGR